MEDILYAKHMNTNNKIHPKARANILSTLCFCWAFPIFIKGLKKDLTEEDLYGPLKEHESKNLGTKLKKNWEHEVKMHESPSLVKTIIKVYYKEYFFYAFFMIIQELVVKLCQPLLVGKLLEFYAPKQTTVSEEEAYLYASGIVLTSLVDRMIQHSSFFGMQHLSMKMQVACRCLIYQKALKLSRNAMAKSTIGQMVNLISNDVSRFNYLCLHLHQVFVSPIQVMLVMYLLFGTLSPSAMVGIGLLMAFTPFQFYLGKKTSFYRFRTAFKTDKRIRMMNEIITGLKLIKMYTWEKPFAKLVELARKSEIHEIQANCYLRTIYGAIGTFLIRTSVFFCILTYVLTGNTLQAQFVYVVTSFYGTLRQPLTIHLPRCIAVLAEVNVSVKRIQTFLMNEEIQSTEESKKVIKGNIGVIMDNVCVKWDVEPESAYTLKNINFKVESQQLVAIVGPVGGGKTTLLQVILKEIPLAKGNLDLNGIISYAPQEPWLFTASIRQNILFGLEMNQEKYEQVVKVCALEKDFAMFPYGDRTIVGERGVLLSGGQKARVSLARAVYKNADIYLLDDPLSAVDAHVGKEIFSNCITGYLKHKCVVLITHQIQYLSNVDKIFLIENGYITTSGTYNELKNSKNDFVSMLTDKTEITTEEIEEEEVKIKEIKKDKPIVLKEETKQTEIKEHRGVGTISNKVYLTYFQTGGGYLLPFLMLSFFLFTQFGASGVDYFLTLWVNYEQEKLQSINKTKEESFQDVYLTSDHLLYIYATIIVFLIIMSLARSVCFVIFCMRASRNLHDNMFNAIVQATMRFFDTNPSGRVLNRFSRDMNVVDEEVPFSLLETLRIFLEVVAITILLSVVNPWIIIPSIIIFVVFYGYKTIFLATSRDLKRMESTARSPMFSHLTASLQGLSTIRAFSAQEILNLEFYNHLDHHSSAFFMFMSCSRTFGFWLDMTCIVYIGLVIFSFLFMASETYGGNVGLAITQSITLTGTLQAGIRQWSELENQMTSVERLVEYADLPSEPNEGKKIPSESWPQNGKIEMQNVSMKYSKDSPYVLKNLEIKIKPKEKIGVVGRTGAGKSSLITTLFRLAGLEGKLTIDDLDIEEMPLNNLRSKISIIPQEPILFSGTLRKNLDPFDEYNDSELWNALSEVELSKTISELPAGLSSQVAEGGSNFSVGERQLLCLARAIIRSNKILIMDEATANVDLQTDELIQNTIRRKFKDCTVLTIAHRLYTVMDSDKILVLSDGKVEEFDHPYVLLQNKESVFYGLVQETGEAMTENLFQIAKVNYTL